MRPTRPILHRPSNVRCPGSVNSQMLHMVHNIGRTRMIFPVRKPHRLLAVVGVALLAWAPTLMAASVPIAVTGFNVDVVTENTATPFASGFDGTSATAAAWFEAGIGGHTDGLPNSRTFTNDGTNNTTNTGTVFTFQPYNANNAVGLTAANTTGTLTLTTPGAFSVIAILATSGNGGGTSTAVLNFAGGTTSTITYSATDWNQNSSPAGPAALGNLGRNTGI